jgi:hypothetical protein
MTSFKVTWTIEVEADTPIEAAYQAWEIQHDPLSMATVFEVSTIPSNQQEPEEIDLVGTKVWRDRHDH